MLPRRMENTYLARPPDFEADHGTLLWLLNGRPLSAELKDSQAQNENTQEAA